MRRLSAFSWSCRAAAALSGSLGGQESVGADQRGQLARLGRVDLEPDA
ncbi:hypothetical protein ACWDRX_18160 [Streptomyces nigra]